MFPLTSPFGNPVDSIAYTNFYNTLTGLLLSTTLLLRTKYKAFLYYTTIPYMFDGVSIPKPKLEAIEVISLPEILIFIVVVK